MKNIVKLEMIVNIQGNIEVLHICNLKYSVPKKIIAAFHNGFNYDYRFIVKQLAGEFKKMIYLFRKKHQKIHNLYSSNRKISYKN